MKTKLKTHCHLGVGANARHRAPRPRLKRSGTLVGPDAKARKTRPGPSNGQFAFDAHETTRVAVLALRAIESLWDALEAVATLGRRHVGR